MSITIDGGAGVTFPDSVQQTNGMTMTGGNPRYYAARAWGNINGVSDTVRAGVNISSVTSSTTGRYTITFTTPMPDANYAVVATVGDTSTSDVYYVARIYGAPTTSSVTIQTVYQSGGSPTRIDVEYIFLAVFR